jgi:hypothetical protein
MSTIHARRFVNNSDKDGVKFFNSAKRRRGNSHKQEAE